jgi:DnaK suppressor protein
MEQKDIDYFKSLLINQLEELLKQGDDAVSSMRDPHDNLPDPTDRASFDFERNFMLRMRDRESKLIHKIRKAIERVEEGTFGICETCGEDIPMKRLIARPVTTQCIECKTKEEALEKVSGE